MENKSHLNDINNPFSDVHDPMGGLGQRKFFAFHRLQLFYMGLLQEISRVQNLCDQCGTILSKNFLSKYKGMDESIRRPYLFKKIKMKTINRAIDIIDKDTKNIEEFSISGEHTSHPKLERSV